MLQINEMETRLRVPAERPDPPGPGGTEHKEDPLTTIILICFSSLMHTAEALSLLRSSLQTVMFAGLQVCHSELLLHLTGVSGRPWGGLLSSPLHMKQVFFLKSFEMGLE